MIIMNLHFLIPGDINTLTGGYVYDKIIINGLRNLGYGITVHQLGGDFPFPSAENLEHCKRILDSIPNRELVFIDSLAFGPMHMLLKDYQGKNPILPIIHLPLSQNPNYNEESKKLLAEQERRAFDYANSVVAVSWFTKQLIVGYGVNPDNVWVITPGVFRVPRKTEYPGLPENILCVGSFLPGKGQLVLVHALADMQQYAWSLSMYGIPEFDTDYVQSIKKTIDEAGLAKRVLMHKQVSGDELNAAYLRTDLFILPSLFENFSMALNDALIHGIPVITTTAGGIPFSVPKSMGLFISPGSQGELKQAIKELLTNSSLYKHLYRSASQYYKTANTWENSIHRFHSLILDVVNED
jgi:glycosyltransferase involved in cell wall biosynthesis